MYLLCATVFLIWRVNLTSSLCYHRRLLFIISYMKPCSWHIGKWILWWVSHPPWLLQDHGGEHATSEPVQLQFHRSTLGTSLRKLQELWLSWIYDTMYHYCTSDWTLHVFVRLQTCERHLPADRWDQGVQGNLWNLHLPSVQTYPADLWDQALHQLPEEQHTHIFTHCDLDSPF